ncbi:DUF4326 domain-containing protein [Paracoccus litorisediminis]|uniref:DUF4326 domain-containing protein n=1 Tax=Paracoccus litorisediminis TaxID=2006130 RepID=UPI0037348FBF
MGEQVLEQYVRYLHTNPGFIDRVRRELAGKDLICWCAPEACHGHILRDIAMGCDIPAQQLFNQGALDF